MGKKINEIGNVYGRLTVIEEAGKNKENRTLWLCQCECGNKKIIPGTNLRKGTTKSCGCLSKDVFLQHVQERFEEKNLVGQRFGRLLVIEKTEKRQYGKVIYKCQCDCGNICEVCSNSLVSNLTKSCGCLSKEKLKEHAEKMALEKDLTGQRFNKLLVLERTSQRTNNGNVIYKCLCDCGNITYMSQGNLKSALSCGCSKSKGEYKISQILNNNNISFEKEKAFDNCKFLDTDKPARFDFYVNNQYIIEYDGEQHFQLTRFNGASKEKSEENFKKGQEHDQFKNQYCKDNNIPIIRIPYTKYDTLCLEDLLLETSQYILN